MKNKTFINKWVHTELKFNNPKNNLQLKFFFFLSPLSIFHESLFLFYKRSVVSLTVQSSLSLSVSKEILNTTNLCKFSLSLVWKL